MEFPQQHPVHITDVMDVAHLVAYLRADSRTRPVVLLTIAHGQHAPYVPLAEVVQAANGRADVVVLVDDLVTRRFAGAVATGAAVYRGACRVYPPGHRWEDEPFCVPLRMTRDADEIARLPGLLLGDLRRELNRPPDQPRPAPSAVPVAPPGPAPRPAAVPAPVAAATPRASGVPTAIGTQAEAETLAAYLRRAERMCPVVVVSRPVGAVEANADVEQLRTDLAGLADVCELVSAQASWAFAHAVPPMCQVYGGAGRVYPVGDAWLTDPYSSPLRFAWGLQDRVAVTRQLIADAMGMASRGTYATPVASEEHRQVSGTVQGVVAGRGLVKLNSGDNAVLWPELTESGVAAEQLFAKDMAVTGDWDPNTRRIDVRGMRRDPVEAVAAYQPADTILVRIAEVSRDSCAVELFPGVIAQVAAEDVTDEAGADLRGFVSPGETVPALVVHHDPAAGEWLLSLTEADEAAAARPAVAILAGGPPWLVPPPPLPEAAEPAKPEPGTIETLAGLEGETDLVRELRLEAQQLARMLKAAQGRAVDLENQLNALKAQRRESTRQRSRADREANARRRAEDDQTLFLVEADQLDFEIRLSWARLIPAADKESWPLPERWTYGEDFFETLREVHGVSRDKVVEVIVHVLTGRAIELASRQLHQLRSGPGGDDPPRTRNGGETCWRVSLQHKTPSARRLHYWMCLDGTIELSSIRQHDDFRS